MAPENTLAAARKALELGAHMWELDVQMTADEQLIVIHDTTLKRTSNVRDVFPNRKPWRVHEFTLDEFRLLDFGAWFKQRDPFGQIGAGKVTAPELASYEGEPAPTLEEALTFTRKHNWLANIEIIDLKGKPGNTQIVDKVVRLVEKLDMLDMVLISSFNHDYLAQIRSGHSRIATGVLVTKPHSQPASLLRRLGAQSYHPRRIAVRSKDIASLNIQGFRVYVRTINKRETMQRLLKAGVDGIFTDFPQILARVLSG